MFAFLETMFWLLDCNWFLSEILSSQSSNIYILTNVMAVLVTTMQKADICAALFSICNLDDSYVFPSYTTISKANQATTKEI